MNPLGFIDNVIDRITMYRLVIYYLVFLILVAAGLSLRGDITFSWWSLLVSTSILVAACWGLNKIFGRIFRAPINNESPLITAGILALIITPDISKLGIAFLLAAAGLATASKYILAINRKHIFNPAAIAVLLTGLVAGQAPSWWVGSAVMMPFVLAGGVLVIRKLRRTLLIVTFVATTAIVTAGLTALAGGDVLASLRSLALSSAIFFLAFVMLTEPQTSPPSQGKRAVYAGLVGALMAPQVHILNFYTSPELALVIGNIFAYAVSPRTKVFPVLQQKLQVAANVADFIFTPDRPLAYEPGQYIELTLPHAHKDARGERRYFTLASSPTEPSLRIGAKFYKPSSSFKRAMLAMTSRTPLSMGQLSGDFTLPKDPNQKLAFIAGGIGITPFRSMAKYLLDTKQHRDVVLLYGVQSASDIAYRPIFEEARGLIGLKTLYVLSSAAAKAAPHTITGTRITPELISQVVPDFRERLFYVSGTHDMTTTIRHELRALGVPNRQIKIDFFPGYV
jgi:ferredoxin-NADP reductase